MGFATTVARLHHPHRMPGQYALVSDGDARPAWATFVVVGEPQPPSAWERACHIGWEMANAHQVKAPEDVPYRAHLVRVVEMDTGRSIYARRFWKFGPRAAKVEEQLRAALR